MRRRHLYALFVAVVAVAVVSGEESGYRERLEAEAIAEHDAFVAQRRTEPLNRVPSMVHLSFGEARDAMTVVWSTGLWAPAVVEWGTVESALSESAKGTTTWFNTTNALALHWYQTATMTGLPGNRTTIFYRVGDGGTNWSRVFWFRTRGSGTQNAVIFGDMGRVGGSPTVQRIVDRVFDESQPPLDAIIGFGDYAYDLNTDGGLYGDSFMQRAEAFAAYVPTMLAVGNHEIGPLGEYQQYRHRFRMPNYAESENMWYSFDLGPAHFMVYSTECLYAPFGNLTKDTMLEWLESDLQAAMGSRDTQPLIVSVGHRPFRCSNDDGDACTTNDSPQRVALESLFWQNGTGVDVCFEAHEHSYERTWPYVGGNGDNEVQVEKTYDAPRLMPHWILGTAGCNEQHELCMNPILGPRGPWSAFRAWLDVYGWGEIAIATGGSDVTLRVRVFVDRDGSVIDDVVFSRPLVHATKS